MWSMIWVWPICLALCIGRASASDLLNLFQPSQIQSSHGVTSEISFSTAFVELEPGSLAFHLPYAMKNLQFAEPVWVIGYKTSIVDARGAAPRENYLCHTFLADERVMQREDQELKGIYSDAFTPEVRLPEGLGIPFAAGERLHWMPMFNNRADEAVRVAMKVVVTVIRAKDLKKPLTPVYATLRSVEVPHLFFVPPGHNERQLTFQSPFSGNIHFLGTHLHPHGVSIELYNLTRRERVWKGTHENGPSGPMQVYSDRGGYPVRAGETYRITAAYDNPTAEEIDAMAGLFMLYSRN
jgi:hypothetical protein